MANQTVILDSNLIQLLSLTRQSIEEAGFELDSSVSISLEPGKITLQKINPKEESKELP